jgi:hypothetical protein
MSWAGEMGRAGGKREREGFGEGAASGWLRRARTTREGSGGGWAAQADWATREGRGRAGPRQEGAGWAERGKREKERFFPFSLNLDEWFHNFNQSKQMHGSAWCSKQKKVFLGFYFTRDLKPNPAIMLEKIKA